MQVSCFLKLCTCICKTWIVTNFHLYIVQMWFSFSDIFVNVDVVNAQSGEVYSLKNPVEPPYGAARETRVTFCSLKPQADHPLFSWHRMLSLKSEHRSFELDKRNTDER